MKCPTCGGVIWCVEYVAEVRQPAVVSFEDGHTVVRYDEPATIIEEVGPGTLRCRGCDYTIEKFEEV